MKVRLAFAVAAFLEPEILIVDEVLAVGDADFQKKAIGKMQDVSRGEGRTVLFVSHNMGSIQNLCSRCLLLENGVLRLDNSVDKVIGAYQSGLSNKMYSPVYQIDSIYGPLSVKLLNSEHRPTCNFRIGDQLVFKFNFSFPVTVERFNIGIGINNVQGNRIVTYHTSYEYGRNIKISPGLIVCCTINEFCLVVGSYYVEISLFHNSKDTFYNNKSVFCIDLIEADFFNTGKLPNKKQGLIVQKSKWQFNGV